MVRYHEKKARMILIGLSIIPNLQLQLRFKTMLTRMDYEDYGNGEISNTTFKIKTVLRYIPIGGLAMAALDIGSDLVTEAEYFTAEKLNEMTDEELKILYEHVKKA